MPIIITVFVIAILGATHYGAYSAGRNSKIDITKAKLKELFMLELEDAEKTNSKRKNIK